MRINWNLIKGVLLLGLVVFLYAFSSHKNNGRSVANLVVQFTGKENVYITTEMVNKLLIQNQEQLYNLPKDNLDLKEMEFLLESNDMIKSAQVYLTVNGEVRAKIEQKQPIARVYSNTTFYILNRSIQHDIAYANKIFQYMSFAKPILVSNATAQKELVERVSSGLVHEEKNEEDFCCKVIELYQNNDKAEKLGKNGKEFIENEFSWEITSKALVKLYDEL